VRYAVQRNCFQERESQTTTLIKRKKKKLVIVYGRSSYISRLKRAIFRTIAISGDEVLNVGNVGVGPLQ
jgi:hypothetical protein